MKNILLSGPAGITIKYICAFKVRNLLSDGPNVSEQHRSCQKNGSGDKA